MNTAHQTIKLGNRHLTIRDTPLRPPILSASKQLEIENKRLKQQLNALIMKDSTADIFEIKKMLENIQVDLIPALQPARSTSNEAKDLLKEILQPRKTEKKLSKKEQLQSDAKELSAKRALALIQKHAKQPNKGIK